MDAFFGPGANVDFGGMPPPKPQVISGKTRIVDRSVRKVNINAYNMRNVNIENAWNDNAVVANAPSDYRRPSADDPNRSRGAVGPNGNTPFNLSETLRSRVQDVVDTAKAPFVQAPPKPYTEINVRSKNAIGNTLYNINNDISETTNAPEPDEEDESESGDADSSDQDDTTNARPRPPRAASNPDVPQRQKRYPKRPSARTAQTTPAYPSQADTAMEADANPALPTQHAATTSSAGQHAQPSRGQQQGFKTEYINDHVVANFDAHNMYNTRIVNALNKNSRIHYRVDSDDDEK